MIRAILSAVLFGVVSITLARNGIDTKKESYWLIMGCAVAIALVYYFVEQGIDYKEYLKELKQIIDEFLRV